MIGQGAVANLGVPTRTCVSESSLLVLKMPEKTLFDSGSTWAGHLTADVSYR